MNGFRSRMPRWKLERARSMRRHPTQAEAVLWEVLRGQRPRWRQQAPMLGFIADFYCPRARLVVEVDGGVHAAQVEYDLRRSQILTRHGFTVLRVANGDVLRRLDSVLDTILARTQELSSPPPG